jgi:hypothetical protein
MALVTAPQPTIPDFEHEYHTVIVDTTDQINAQMTKGITVFLPTTIENIVQVQLMAARFTGIATTTNIIHVSIEELKNTFFQRAKKDLDGADNHINGSFGSIITAGAANLSFKNDYPLIQQYITPIRKLDRLNLKLYKEDGDEVADAAKVFMMFKFICKNRNLM